MKRAALLCIGTLFATLLTGLAARCRAGEPAGFTPLFDGKTLDGWEGDSRFWSVRDGTITGQTTADQPAPHNTFLIWRKGTVQDFELRARFRIVGHNSGIQFRSRELDDFVVTGYQADFDAAGKWTGSLYDEKTGRGVLARRGTKVVIDQDGKRRVVGQTTPEEKILASVKKDGWNQYHIRAVGNHIVLSINGLVTAEVIDHQAGPERRSGILALQLHRGPPMLVQFKDIELKVIRAGASSGQEHQ